MKNERLADLIGQIMYPHDPDSSSAEDVARLLDEEIRTIVRDELSRDD
jgi:hypothetical protein